jgi:hypothetical protein
MSAGRWDDIELAFNYDGHGGEILIWVKKAIGVSPPNKLTAPHPASANRRAAARN